MPAGPGMARPSGPGDPAVPRAIGSRGPRHRRGYRAPARRHRMSRRQAATALPHPAGHVAPADGPWPMWTVLPVVGVPAALPATPARRARRRRRQPRRAPRHLAAPSGATRRRAARVRLLLGSATLIVGLVLATVPAWTAWWNSAAQRYAARTFGASAGQTGTIALDASAAATGDSTGHGVLGRAAGNTEAGSGAGRAAARPAPPVARGAVLARLVIPAIGVDAYVLRGLTYQPASWNALLRRGPAHLEGSAPPGAAGNAVIFGHVNVWGSVFEHLNRLVPGQRIVLQTPGATFTYRVTGAQTVFPTDRAAIAPHAGPPTLQLVTCAGLWDSERLVVDAALALPRATAHPRSPSKPVHGAAPIPPRAASGPASVAAAVAAARQLVAAREASRLARHLATVPAWRTVLDALGRRDWGQAWAAARAAWTPDVSPAPHRAPGFRLVAAWPLGAGRVRVVVALDGPTPPGRAHQTRRLAYTVATANGAMRIVAVRPLHLTPPVQLDVQPPAAASAWAGGTLTCGRFRVRWRVGPLHAAPNDGFTFWTRSSRLAVTGPRGAILRGIDLPGLALGTYPMACGDLTGGGSESLVLHSVIPPERVGGGPNSATTSIYRLTTGQAVLIGQMLSTGTTALPQLVPPGVGAAYALRIPQREGPALRWTFRGGTYREVG